MNQQPHSSSTLFLAAVLASVLVFPACSVNVKKEANGEDKKVDIETPFGGIHVNKDADARDTGLAVFPGSRPVEKEDEGNQKSANVNLSAGPFGIKVVAVEFQSDAAPEKIVSFYKDQLKKYGTVLECRTTYHADASVNYNHHDKNGDERDDHKLTCDHNGGNDMELKVGTEENQRIVAVQNKENGTKFALVLVQIHGKDTI